MELPIAKQSYLPPAEALVRAIRRADAALAACTSEQESLDAGTVYLASGRAAVPFANFAADLRLPEGVAAPDAVASVLAPFKAVNVRCAWLDANESAWPAPLADAASAVGFAPLSHTVFLLDGYKPAPPRNQPPQIIPARSSYPLVRQIFERQAVTEYRAQGAAIKEFASAFVDQLDEVKAELFLALIDGRPAGVAGVLGLGQIGVLIPAYTNPDFRGKGVAGALMAHVLDFASRALFENVIIHRHDGCPAIPFYTSLGFKPAATFTRYVPRSTQQAH